MLFASYGEGSPVLGDRSIVGEKRRFCRFPVHITTPQNLYYNTQNTLFLVKIVGCNRGGKTTKTPFLPHYSATSQNGTPRNLETTKVIDISDFEKIDFLGHGAILGCSQPLGRLIFCSSDTDAGRQKIFKKFGMIIFF